MPEILTSQVEVEIDHQFVQELRASGDLAGVPLASSDVTSLLGELVDEAVTCAALADRLDRIPDLLRLRIRPQFETEPIVKAIQIELFCDGGDRAVSAHEFSAGPWTRDSQQTALQLREEGTLGENETAVQVLLALDRSGVELELPPLQMPAIAERTLADCGVRGLGEGSLVPDRPVLINRRLAEEAIEQCIAADVIETGGAVFGQIVRLPEPLPGTRTRVVTILAGTITDTRHVGEATQYHFSPAALSDAQQLCDLRGLGEQVLTVFHTHGWSATCSNCNQNAACVLPEASPSTQDYRLLATLFPSKSTLMPIAGRKLGAAGRRPVLQVYAWRKGEMRPIRWQQYED